MTTRQAESLVRRVRELDSAEARVQLIENWPESEPTKRRNKARSLSESEQLLADLSILMRVGVRLEVRLLDVPVDVRDNQVIREGLKELAALLDTLQKALKRALALQEKLDATLA